MNKLPVAKRAQILQLLCEGSSMRTVSRVVGVSFNTVVKMLIDAGECCAAFHDEAVRNVASKRVQVDEVWSFTAAKQKNVATMKKPVIGAGDTWTWTGIDADSKLIIAWFVGGRDSYFANLFIGDLASRLRNRIQLTSDGHRSYLQAVEGAFGNDVDYAMLVKLYGESPEAEKRYSPAECIGCRRQPITGEPDPKHISTSFAERQNLTMRMHMRRFTRLTNAFSKKFESHVHMVALYTVWYNWVRVHKTLKTTPAIASGLTEKLMSYEDIVGLTDARMAPQVRGPYKPRTKAISN